jgi:hypothetical protein
VQAFIAGQELCSYSIAHGGQLLAHSVYRPAYRLNGSSSYYFDPVQRPAIRDAVAAFVQGTGYSGQVSFDWIEGPDGRPLALECNPRATSGLHLFPPDADLPSALMGEGPVHETGTLRARMMGTLMLTAGLQEAVCKGRLAQWFEDWRRADDVIQVPGDRLPMIGSIGDLVSFTQLALRRRCNLREASTLDIRWDGEPLEALDA